MPARRGGSRRPTRRNDARPGSTGALLGVAAGLVAVLVLIVAVGGALASAGADGPEPQGSSRHTVLEPDAAPAGPGDIVIGLNGDAETYVLAGEEFLDGGAHAASPADGILTGKIETSGSVDTSAPGDYQLTYRVADSTGHEASVARTVHVVESMDTMSVGIPVLMYHYVYDPASPPDSTDGNYLSAEKFEEHLAYLIENGFYFPSWPEVRAYLQGTHSLPAKSVVLTFDDGEEGFLSVGGALLAKYQVPATSFVIGTDDETVQKLVTYRNPYIEYESHSDNMHRPGGNVGHGGVISAMTREEIVADLRTSQGMLGSGQAFAYPFGDVTDDAKAAVDEAGVLCAFTTQNRWARIGDDVRALPRVRISGEYELAGFIALVNG